MTTQMIAHARNTETSTVAEPLAAFVKGGAHLVFQLRQGALLPGDAAWVEIDNILAVLPLPYHLFATARTTLRHAQAAHEPDRLAAALDLLRVMRRVCGEVRRVALSGVVHRKADHGRTSRFGTSNRTQAL